MTKDELAAKEQAFMAVVTAMLKSGGRMGLWGALALLGVVVMHFIAPQMVKVSLFKVTLMPLAAYLGYWIDRGAFASELRPHVMMARAAALREQANTEGISVAQFQQNLRDAETLAGMAYHRYARRAAIIAAALVAVALGS